MGELFKVTNLVVMLWVAAGLTLVVLVAGARVIAASTVTGGRFGNLVEAMVDFVRGGIVEEFLGEHTNQWFSFFAAIFFFVLFCNLLGKLPVPFAESPTGNWNVTGALAVTVFLISQVVGIVKMGPVGYFKAKFLFQDAPGWLQPLALLIKPIILIAEPFSLMVRLFANMLAGHMVMFTFATAQMVGGLWLLRHPNALIRPLAGLPFAISVVLLGLEFFIAFIQAFIFALLSALYLSESLEEHH